MPRRQHTFFKRHPVPQTGVSQQVYRRLDTPQYTKHTTCSSASADLCKGTPAPPRSSSQLGRSPPHPRPSPPAPPAEQTLTWCQARRVFTRLVGRAEPAGRGGPGQGGRQRQRARRGGRHRSEKTLFDCGVSTSLRPRKDHRQPLRRARLPATGSMRADKGCP